MKLSVLLLFLLAPFASAESVLEIKATTTGSLEIGKISLIRFEIKNNSEEPVAILEVRPDQPCEEPVSLIRTLYGRIEYDKETDEYVYDSMPQSAAMIPVLEGFLAPGKVLWLNLHYRPYASSEDFQIHYAKVSGQKIYARSESDGGFITKFTPHGEDPAQIILNRFVDAEKLTGSLSVTFHDIQGEQSKFCSCRTAGGYSETIPAPLCKAWDLGKSVRFRVGEKQEGIGPEPRFAGWNFLELYEVNFGDGMYTHGEFVVISANQAPGFIKKIENKYSMKRIFYFQSEFYYDLEPIP